MKKLKTKLRNWLIDLLDLNQAREGLRDHEHRIKAVEGNVKVGVDIHTQSDSWVVLCLEGKVDVVSFYRLPHATIHDLQMQLRDLQKRYGTNVRCDTPPFCRDILRTR